MVEDTKRFQAGNECRCGTADWERRMIYSTTHTTMVPLACPLVNCTFSAVSIDKE
jgi:hypothetical protein